jgi:hypothetical protein
VYPFDDVKTSQYLSGFSKRRSRFRRCADFTDDFCSLSIDNGMDILSVPLKVLRRPSKRRSGTRINMGSKRVININRFHAIHIPTIYFPSFSRSSAVANFIENLDNKTECTHT